MLAIRRFASITIDVWCGNAGDFCVCQTIAVGSDLKLTSEQSPTHLGVKISENDNADVIREFFFKLKSGNLERLAPQLRRITAITESLTSYQLASEELANAFPDRPC